MALDQTIITHTNNPSYELLQVASKTNISAQELDFTLLAFSTQYRFGATDWTKISEKELVLFEKDEIFLRNDLQIEQEYKIEIFHNTKENKIANSIKLGANKNLTKIVAQIDLNTIEFHEKLGFELLQNIYKKMLKLRFLIGIRTFDFKKNLLSLISKHKKTPLKQSVKIVIAKGVEPKQSQDEDLILLYKEKLHNFSLDEKLSGIISVDENEAVLRHTKAKNGKEGKDLNLHTLEIVQAKQNAIQFSCSNAFKVIENEEFTEYQALKKGFIVEKSNNFDIANVLEFQAVDFKNTGIIRAGLDKNVTINIKFPSDIEDAVNSGVGIECEELNISGNVASNTNLSATRLRIDGSTHSKAKIKAKEAFIKTHRGFVEAENISIDLLEGGNVKAKTAKIKKSFGGTIEAENLYIENVTNNTTCVFYNTVVVEQISGNNNKFLCKVKSLDKDYEKDLKIIDEKDSTLNRTLQVFKQSMLANKNTIAQIEGKITELKNSGKNIPKQYEQILKDYSLHTQKIHKLQKEKNELAIQKETLHKEILTLQNILFKAKMINKNGKWGNANEVRFSLLQPKKELFYSPSEKEQIKLIELKKNELDNTEHIEIDKQTQYNEKDLEWLSPSKE
ncbi:DUF342 domain-containing protein [Campylobacter sp. MIT 21-1685]|uniref:flagellar assembly protein A n=1 Tax=unclassified Campylobacter TaxID=2593542 RepID=UPI00224A7A7D|nr:MULTISPECIES: flagellar assembly protein A [unclassified Campylobacter]MCX2683597.1 DUF342 domain-containing protein [Campylobacter sp. MIT 21-1684]MCX2751880.1 DUF342 domain-containing protein [Campylobacter sp. MIT 21-1682]MCX2808067.1 DUF342 domain-containing protein [Campylobacter sp. MIT 21-1685]